MTDGRIPISDEQAKAIAEAIKALQGLGDFLNKTFGIHLQNLIGYLGGDWLGVRRAQNLAHIIEKARERLRARDAKEAEPASLSVTLPILIAAAEESRDELQDLWARLLTAAADPSRAKSFRTAFIDAAKRMDPLDAAALQSAHEQSGGGVMGIELRRKVSAHLKVYIDASRLIGNEPT
ncbi:MAG: Abi-alpha family protein [Xanthobacteraceae bacterium]